jgi:excisionase family DNA binding protein
MNISEHANSYVDSKHFETEFSLSRRTFFLWIKEGRLAAYKPSSRKTLVKRADVEKLLEASRAPNDLDRIVDETVAEVLGR